jgi:hypothetical protein
LSTRCPDCGQDHGWPRCLPPKAPEPEYGSYKGEFAVTLQQIMTRPRVKADGPRGADVLMN